MAPRARRGEAAEPQAFHELGVRGRKTGVFLPDGGERDEHGMQPLDDVFSSPEKGAAQTNGADDSGSEDMDIASSAGPGPRTLLKNQRNVKFPIPRSRSPLKTNLNSPARKNPHVGRGSSPTRDPNEDRDSTVTRRLDFNARVEKSRLAPSAKGRANGAGRKMRDVEEEESALDDQEDLSVSDMVEESLQMVDAMGGDDDENEAEAWGSPQEQSQEEPEPEPEEEAPPVKRQRGRPRRESRENDTAQASRQTKNDKRRRSLRSSLGDEGVNNEPEQAPSVESDDEEPRQAKRQRTQGPKAAKAAPPLRTTIESQSKSAKAPARAKTAVQEKAPAQTKADDKPKAKGKPGRKPKERRPAQEEDAGETSFAALQRGPPMPKSRGLVSVRRDADGITQTRSGRHSYKPVEYWRGEQVIREDEEQTDMFYNGDFVLPSIKEVVRVPNEAPPSKRAPRSKARATAKAKAGRGRHAVDEDEDLEDWEINPGTVMGEVVLWEPEHEEHPPADDEPVQVMDDRVAISADAIQTSDIKDATFRFAKTLTMPFMGAGVVDLPPGSEKRPKNSRKMHMVFFVHYGKVSVTINEAQFRISAGGMWFVPRGNYYSITNDYDNPCRIFFAQGCEVPAAQAGASQNQSTLALGK
ncbi:hypothetical protein HIM_05582 [Hirsutella minnesotensis 3608]|uniref:CENP-C homolog n=1 Tax=Hirsutella minnesotensis 3608 TaxID=1043627 RepID=A0A0F7ZKA4_9HYPO|nr:hypothetical protein HIM_05582 [Hirsutella minnesotensis 3608]